MEFSYLLWRFGGFDFGLTFYFFGNYLLPRPFGPSIKFGRVAFLWRRSLRSNFSIFLAQSTKRKKRQRHNNQKIKSKFWTLIYHISSKCQYSQTLSIKFGIIPVTTFWIRVISLVILERIFFLGGCH